MFSEPKLVLNMIMNEFCCNNQCLNPIIEIIKIPGTFYAPCRGPEIIIFNPLSWVGYGDGLFKACL